MTGPLLRRVSRSVCSAAQRKRQRSAITLFARTALNCQWAGRHVELNGRQLAPTGKQHRTCDHLVWLLNGFNSKSRAMRTSPECPAYGSKEQWPNEGLRLLL